MIYVDTNVLVSYVNESDRRHKEAVELMSFGDGSVASKVTVLELYSVFSRAMEVSEEELEALVEYSLKTCGVDVATVDWEKLYARAIEHSGVLKLRTLDLLHVVAAALAGAEAMVTFDEDITARREQIAERLGLAVASNPDEFKEGIRAL